jgi:hypothetical protein
MKSEQSIYFSIGAGFLLSAVVIVGIALVLVPAETRSDLFWPRTLWTVFLVGLAWGASGSYFSLSARRKANYREAGGIAPSLILVVIIYAVLSFAVMMLHANMRPGETSSRTHLFLQIGLAGGSALVLVFLNFARGHAGLSVQTSFKGIASPADLCDLLSAEESRLAARAEHEDWTKCIHSLKALRETIKYSLPQTTMVADAPRYRKLTQGIETVCQTIHACEDPASPLVDKCRHELDSSILEAKKISSEVIRR